MRTRTCAAAAAGKARGAGCARHSYRPWPCSVSLNGGARMCSPPSTNKAANASAYSAGGRAGVLVQLAFPHWLDLHVGQFRVCGLF